MNAVCAVYFSPTQTPRTVVMAIAGEMGRRLGLSVCGRNLTPPYARKNGRSFDQEDLLVLGLPVYGGRIPAFLEDVLTALTGNGAPAVIAAVYGNRHYDDALLEMQELLEARGFRVVAAGAFVGQHSFTAKVGAGRPDDADLAALAGFAAGAADKVGRGAWGRLQLPGNHPYKERGPALAQIKPLTGEDCYHCMDCSRSCPMGVIHHDDPAEVADGCIRCFACVKCCPVGAKYFQSEMVDKSTAMLEANCMARREPEVFF